MIAKVQYSNLDHSSAKQLAIRNLEGAEDGSSKTYMYYIFNPCIDKLFIKILSVYHSMINLVNRFVWTYKHRYQYFQSRAKSANRQTSTSQ